MMKERCAIIGAGASGLPSIRWALLYGVDPVVFEADKHIGCLWRYKLDGNSVMKSTICNTSKELMAYSDFPPPENFANYMHNTEMLSYLELYAQHFGLMSYIRFNTKVLNIRRSSDYRLTGRWIVEYVDHNQNFYEEVFDCVLLAQGRYTVPNDKIKWPNQDLYKGNIFHSKYYKKPCEVLEDKTTVIVGLGNSAINIAVELGQISRQTILSFRHGAYIVPRVGPYGEPYDLIRSRFRTYFLPRIMPCWLREKVLVEKLEKRFNHEKYGFKANHSVFAKHVSISDDLPYRVISGRVKVKPSIKEFTSYGIIWTDGTLTEPVDNVIFSTGFLLNFDIIEHGKLLNLKENYLPLYKYIYPAELLDHNTLGIIGIMQPNGSIINASEMQARLFFHAFEHKCVYGTSFLPNPDEMLYDIERMKRNVLENFELSDLQQYYVDAVKYNDELAEIIGCKPYLSKFLSSDLKLAYSLLFGPNVAYVYRLHGPHSWDGAREAILSVNTRVDAPFANPDSGSPQSYDFLALLLFMFVYTLVFLFIFPMI